MYGCKNWKKTGMRMSSHRHQFTIPVEWEYSPGTNTYYFEGKLVKPGSPKSRRVSKLMCVCGEEKERV